MGFAVTRRRAARRAVTRAVTVGLVIGVGAAALSGPASGAGTGRSAAGAAHPGAVPQTTVSRSASGLTVDSLPVPAAAATTDRSGAAAELAPTRVQPFGLVGVTWRTGSTPAGLTVSVRLHQADGWTRWRQVPFTASEGPAAGEQPDARAGTDPLWTGHSDGVAVRVGSGTGAAPADIQVVTVDPGADPVAAGAGRGAALPKPHSGDPITGSPRFPSQPRVISRKQWGADPSLTVPCDAPRYGRSAKMVFVHHTVNANKYSAREAPAIVRSIYAYHTQARHWCDIGYNALVDRFGNIYEGRRGGLRRPVRGAHAGDYNTGTVGVSLIGNFEVARPSARMMNALVRFVGWRLGTSYKPVRGKVGIAGTRFDRISGHRDAMATACPGRYVYARLPTVRTRVADYLSRYHSALAAKAARLGVATTGQVWTGERALHGGFRTVFHKGRMFGRDGLGAHLLRGRMLHHYLGTAGPRGPLGWPKSDVRASPVHGIRVLIAQRGRIYAHDKAWLKVIFGPIYARYRTLGLLGSRLGVPVTNVVDTGYGQRADFRHGTIFFKAATGKTRVVYT